jgi:hypothetical protein
MHSDPHQVNDVLPLLGLVLISFIFVLVWRPWTWKQTLSPPRPLAIVDDKMDKTSAAATPPRTITLSHI